MAGPARLPPVVSDFWRRHGDVALCLFVGALALAVRVHGLTDKGPRIDEIITLYRSRLPLAGVIASSLQAHHTPVFFLLMKPVLMLGADDFTLRFPSAMLGAATAALVVLAGIRLANKAAGLVAGLLMALAPFQIEIAQEARSYTLVGLFGMVALLGQIAAMRNGAGNRGPFVAYVIGMAGAIDTLAVATPWFVGANLAAWLGSRNMGSDRWPFLRQWLIAQGIVIVFTAPLYLIIAFSGVTQVVAGFDWVPADSLHNLWSSIASTYLMRTVNLVSFELLPIGLPVAGWIVLLLAIAGVWQLRRVPRDLIVVGLICLSLPVVLLIIDLFKPISVPRYFVCGAAPFVVLAGIGVTALRGLLQPAAGLAAAVLMAVNLAPYYDAETKPRWDLMANEVGPLLRPGDMVLLQGEGRRANIQRRIFEGTILRSIPLPNLNYSPRLVDAVNELHLGHRVWVLYGRVVAADIEPLDAYRVSLRPLGAPSREFVEGESVRVWLFEPPHILRK